LRWCYPNGTPIPTGDELVAQKDAQLSQEQTRTKQALLLGIELGLKLKFGDRGLAILGEISAITDVSLLQAIVSGLSTANSLEEIQQIYRL